MPYVVPCCCSAPGLSTMGLWGHSWILASAVGLRGMGGCCPWLRCFHAWNHSPLFGSGEVSWDCVREHLSSFTYSSWIYLQNTTLALKNWALAMISGH